MNCEAVYFPELATVRFAIYPDGFDGPRILARISERALREVFGARDGAQSLVDVCELNFSVIESKVLESHRWDPIQGVELTARDFPMSGLFPSRSSG